MKLLKVVLIIGAANLTGSCSMHPLQNDVTGLSLFQIVQKVRCEARDAVSGLLAKEGLQQTRDEFVAKRRKIKERTKALLPFRQQTTALVVRNQNLIARKKEIVAAALAMEKLAGGITVPRDFDELTEKIIDQRQDYRRDLARYLSDLARNKINKAPMTLALDSLNYELVTNPKFFALVKFYSHEMAYDFRFKITETNSLEANAAYKLPLPIGSLTVGLNGGDTKERESERNAKLSISFQELDELICPGTPDERYGLRSIHYPIRGNIGLHEVLEQYLKLYSQDGGKFAKASPYSDQIIFTTTLTGGANPSVVLNPAALEQVTASIELSGTRKDLHSVTVSLAPPAATEGDKVTRVQLVTEETIFLD